MKITYILESFQGGGKERRCLQLIQGLNKEGYNDIQVIIINNNNVDYPELYNTSAKITIINRIERNLSIIQTYKEIKKHIKVFNPDIVQPWGELSIFLVALIRLSKKFVFLCANVADCNSPRIFSMRFMVNKFSHFIADKVIGNSFAGLKAYRVSSNKAICIHNGFNEERYKLAVNIDKDKFCEDLQIKTPYIVAMFSRISGERKDKDYDSYILLAKNIISQRDDVTFLAVGKGRDEDINRLKSFLNDKEKEKIKFLGFRSDIEAIMSIIDVSVLFSNYKTTGEGISNVIMESMAFGVPVLATNGGGTPEIITNDVNGYLIDKNDCVIASECLNNILNNPTKHKTLKHNAKNTVNTNFTLSKMVTEYISLYKALL